MSATIKDIYRLTPMQEGMLFHTLLDPDQGAYYQRASLTLSGQVHVHILESSFKQLMERHDVLRTSFIYKEAEQPLQIVLGKRDIPFAYTDLTFHSPLDQELAIAEYESLDQNKGFNLEKDALMRVALFQLTEEKYKLVWSFHHIIMDGWCLGILVDELYKIYSTLIEGKPTSLPAVYPYSDYFSWLDKQDSAQGLRYWEEVLKGYDQRADFPINHLTTQKKYIRRSNSFCLDKNLTHEIEQLATKLQMTVSSVFQTAWGVILQRYNYTNDVVFGSVVSGRVPAVRGIENMVGLFINTIPIRVKDHNTMTFTQLLDEVHQSIIEAGSHSYLPLADVQNQTALKQSLISHIVAFENYPLEDRLSEVSRLEQSFTIVDSEITEHTNYDLEVVVFPGESWEIVFKYNEARYHHEMLDRLADHLKQLLKQVVHNPHILVQDIDILTEQEQQTLLFEFNREGVSFPRDKTIHGLFEEKADQFHDQIALIYDNESLTYGELNHKANCLARKLRDYGVQPNELVAILSDRSIEMVVSILAILKSGGAYLPIDPMYPEDRIKFMLQEGACRLLLIQEVYMADNRYVTEQMNINDPLLYSGASGNLENAAQPSDLAYVIFTSGSTGKPKAVMIEHKNVVQLLKQNELPFNFSDQDIWTMFHSYCFDFSVWEMYGALLNGGKLVVVPKITAQDTRAFYKLVQDQGVTILNQTPSAFYQFIRVDQENPHSELSLRSVIFGGEALNPFMLKDWKQKHASTQLINMYGITETTVHVTYKEIEQIEADTEVSEIGRPLAPLKSYILDERRRLVPIGITGELYISGAGLARGYMNNPDLTAERFVDHPYEAGEKMYRTGDLARWLPNGSLEYWGRIDHQVKIRGYRIELGEIEKQLTTHEAIEEAFLMTRYDHDRSPFLCAYYVSHKKLEEKEIKNFLREFLPEYMIPATLIAMDNIPLNANGKVDRKALPEPKNAGTAASKFIPAQSKLEKALAHIWMDVLGIERVGLNDHFFELGGHSLKAMTLVAKVGKGLGIELSLQEVFQNSTLEAMANLLKTNQKSQEKEINIAAEAQYYPLSSAQKRLFIVNQVEGQSTTYNMPTVIKLQGKLDRERLVDALQLLVDRHDAFRTSFDLLDGEPVQRITSKVEIQLDEIILTNQARLEEIFEGSVTPFDLSQAPLLRAQLVQLTGNEAYLLIDMHHIISDGISVGVLVDELAKAYSGEALPELRIQYKDYAVWQQQEAHGEAAAEGKQYWLDKFAGEIPVLNLATDFVRPPLQSFAGASFSMKLGTELTSRLKARIAEAGTTLYMYMLSAYYVLLSKYSGQEDIVVGTAVAGRSHADVERMIGMFVSTLALRSCPVGSKTFADYLQEVHRESLAAFEHQQYPYEELIEQLKLERDMSRNPLFDTMFVVQNTGSEELELEGLSVSTVTQPSQVSKFDWTVIVTETGDDILMDVEYATSLFKKDTIERMMSHYLELMDSALREPNQLLSELEMMTVAEREEILNRFNDTAVDYPREKTVHQLFEEQVAMSPEQLAIAGGDERLSYRALNERANALAWELSERGVGSGSIVAIMAERSVEIVVGMLAVLKAGGAYLPVAPDYPAERIQYMLEDSEARLMLVKSEYLDQCSYGIETIELKDAAVMEVRAEAPAGQEAQATDLVYMMYTSGSTGRPKGVMVEHRGVVRLVKNSNCMTFEAGSRLLQTGAQVFDISTFEIWGALLNGLELYVADRYALLDPLQLKEIIQNSGISLMQLTTPLFHQIVQEYPDTFEGLKQLMVGGDVLSTKQAAEVLKACPGLTLVNAYGPTENTVISCFWTMEKEEDVNGITSVPIGRPLANSFTYVVNQYGQLLPPGIPGELWVGGDGVARGYKNRQELTAEKFGSNPFANKGRIYRTGDLAMWNSDGTLQYIGRTDDQVKIRGFRIELGEVERQISSHPEADQVVVMLRTTSDNHKYLCAYVVSSQLTSASLKNYLEQRLPEYMLPSVYMFMHEFPMNHNGKIDKKSLPEPIIEADQLHKLIMPIDENEQLILEVWQSVLGVKEIGTNSNFFELGGDSIKAIQVTARLRNHGYHLSVKHLLMNPEIRKLSKWIEREDKSIDQGMVEGEVELTPIQQWFFSNQFTDMHHWNQAVMLFRPEGFDVAIVRKVFTRLVEHHDALRMVYRFNEGNVRQYNLGTDSLLFDLTIEDISNMEGSETLQHSIEQIHSSMSLSEGPLVKLGLFHGQDGDHLLIAAHHLVIDGISWRILFEDFTTAYTQTMNNKPIHLPGKTNSYRDWVNGLRQYSEKHVLKRELGYWSRLAMTTLETLPRKAPLASRKVKDSKVYQFKLSSSQTEDLMTKSYTAYGTEINDLLVCALGLAVKQWSGIQQVAIQMEGHGREEIVQGCDISRTVGWFTSIFPVLLDTRHSDELSVQIKQTKELLRSIPNKGIGYSLLRFMTESGNHTNLNIQPEISFNYLGQFDEDLNTELFRASSLSIGEPIGANSQRLTPLDITGIVENNELSMSIVYDLLEFDDSAIETFGQLFKQNLQNIITHCTTKQEKEITPSDVSEDLTLEELEAIQNFYEV